MAYLWLFNYGLPKNRFFGIFIAGRKFGRPFINGFQPIIHFQGNYRFTLL